MMVHWSDTETIGNSRCTNSLEAASVVRTTWRYCWVRLARFRCGRILPLMLLGLIVLQVYDGNGESNAFTSTNCVRHWNAIAIDASGLDHTPVTSKENRTFGEQLGPGRASRAMAIVHIAIFDAVNAIVGGYQSYTDLPAAPANTSVQAAIGQAAHDTLAALFPSQTAYFDQQLAADLAQIESGRAKENGTALGRRAAAAILELRANDGAAA
jgi:hypothetical protein